MIISFNPAIFQTQDDDMQSILADILIELLKDNHFIDTRSIEGIFFDNEKKYIFSKNKIAQSHLSDTKREYLALYIETKIRQPITKLYRDHITHITIGTNPGEIHPRDAYKILTERSKIIVENIINDGKFIKGICQKYSSKKSRKTIYKLIDIAIKKEILEFYNAGGIGGIETITQYCIDASRYSNIHKYKLMAIFDSDKTHINDFKERYRNLIEFLKSRPISKPPENNDISYEDNDLIIWHILYKRKIENYIPLDILFKKAPFITQTQKDHLSSKSESDLDFLEYNKDNNDIGQMSIKKEFPEMFISDFSYRELEKRCEHHKVFLPEANESVSELEQILLKIAKII
ncbi:hypothetical protein [Aphanizomenon flos-aquae]|jgi:hypothetical protein|uniref:hypothetical protein n=1 Tax=Aphanizomenon flos-aquae TaxID=1176 RepID=UPI000485435F|nr:hypothetical protein [Aphanizomenon flos-aquae]